MITRHQLKEYVLQIFGFHHGLPLLTHCPVKQQDVRETDEAKRRRDEQIKRLGAKYVLAKNNA